MSIIIKGMEMPKNCTECRFEQPHCGDHLCIISMKFIDPYETRNLGPCPCPLIELPQHGDLIDRDEYEVFSYTGTEGRPDTFDDGVMFMLDRLSDAQVIIPREEKEEW